MHNIKTNSTYLKNLFFNIFINDFIYFYINANLKRKFILSVYCRVINSYVDDGYPSGVTFE